MQVFLERVWPKNFPKNGFVSSPDSRFSGGIVGRNSDPEFVSLRIVK
ncbi:hypothetical protein LEP1GSC061_3409 [Leptospira wolffii serovar Khorat str. Khorat-H2]|nr:hypothetical protein LEP1GSC061_3409 [Leptospira wolffii serovar Khorat str. Khorat-H2]